MNVVTGKWSAAETVSMVKDTRHLEPKLNGGGNKDEWW
jgi:hypothetical protein